MKLPFNLFKRKKTEESLQPKESAPNPSVKSNSPAPIKLEEQIENNQKITSTEDAPTIKQEAFNIAKAQIKEEQEQTNKKTKTQKNHPKRTKKEKQPKKTEEPEKVKDKVLTPVTETPPTTKEFTDEKNSNDQTYQDNKKIINKEKTKRIGAIFGANKKPPQRKSPKEIEEEQENADKLLRDASKKKMRSKFDKKKVFEKRRLEKILDEAIEKAGYDFKGKAYHKNLKISSIVSAILLTIILSFVFHMGSYSVPTVITFEILSLASMIAASYIIALIGSFIFFDYRSYQRTKEIEEVLPEFLQLASANISAGMPIDRALWFAVRPKFGVLAKEIEEVAKATMAGEDLEQALENFTKKYDSQSLREAMNLLIEGMRAGGEIGFLLNQIAANMQDIKLMRKEIAASIMSYVIFITAAAIIGAPFLLALSTQLLIIMGHISSSVQIDDSSSGSSGMFKLDMSSDSIDVGDFKFFAIVTLIISSVFSAMIISMIRKGNTTESLKSIPVFIIVSLLIFFAANALFGGLLGGFFT